MKPVTQADIARRLGVAQQTVGFALNNYRNSRMSLKAETRERIVSTAQQMGYVPHHAARRLARARGRVRTTSFDQAGLIYFGGRSQYLDTVCLAMIFGAEHELSKLRASFVFVNVGTPGGWEKVDRMARASGVDGWLVYGPMDDETVTRLRRGRLPFVILGDHRCTEPVHCVRVDNAAVGRLAAQHLASRGHRRVAYLAGGNDNFVYQVETLAGFRAARTEFGLDEDERLILPLPIWASGDGQRIVEWVRRADPKPTALFASELDFAAGVCRTLRQAQMDVPGDISVLGYELGEVGPQTREFSRIESPMTEVGRQGAALLHRIAVESVIPPREVKIAPRLVEGGTVTPPRSTS